jgi:hypothetical protein
MTTRSTPASTDEVTMKRPDRSVHRDGQRGQILVVAVLAMIAMIGGVALVLEGGNAYAHQRIVQNSADSVANAGATVLADYLSGTARTDLDVANAMTALSDANTLNSHDGVYVDWKGKMLTLAGTPAASRATAAIVGGGVIPANAQGVQVGGSQAFGTTFGRVIGFTQFTASAEATAIAGPATGGTFLPVIFPVNITECGKSGDLGIGETKWTLSKPGTPPVGQEYIVPLCKTGGGSFMILDFDGTANNCDDEVTNPPALQFPDFPVTLASDNGNNCAKEMMDAVNAKHGQVVMIPICDEDCVTSGGSHATYHIVKVAAFYLDYMSDTGSDCQGNNTTLIPIRGNGSSSCIAGWFVRYVTTGSVGAGPIIGAGAGAVQLIR